MLRNCMAIFLIYSLSIRKNNMEIQYRKKVIENFIAFATKEENRAELFETNGNFVVTELLMGYKIICRSAQIDSIFKRVVKSVKSNANSQGFLYFLHQVGNNDVVYPLYLGIAKRKGKSNEISTLFNSDFPRWGHYKNGNFHLSSLNAVVFSEGYSDKDFKRYKSIYLEWAKRIFKNTQFPIPKGGNLELREKLYLSVIEWGENQCSFVEELGNTTIKCEEGILINLLYDFYPDKLLNKDI